MDKLIEAGLRTLRQGQQVDGSFVSHSSLSLSPFISETTYHTTFMTSLILISLASLPSCFSIEEITRKGVAFLHSQKSVDWSFNYWARHSHQAHDQPYPDDLDDTSLALAALSLWDPDCFDGEAWAHIVKVLTTCEYHEGGPYKTWLVPSSAPKVWHDRDLAVNSNVAFFLSRHEIVLPRIVTMIEKAIGHASYRSPYYPSFLPVIFFIARWYRGPQKQKILAYLLTQRHRDGTWGSPLSTALAVCSWLRLGGLTQDIALARRFLIKVAQKGLWQAESFCLDPAQNAKPYYAGSLELTIAICLESLTLLAKTKQATTSPVLAGRKLHQTQRVFRTVRGRITQRVARLPLSFGQTAGPAWNEILDRPAMASIVATPSYIYDALGPSRKKRVKRQVVTTLCTAAAYGWLAYTLYDRCFDTTENEALIPLATIAMREMVILFSEVLRKNHDFMNQLQLTLDQLDRANHWEIIHCRFVVANNIVTFPSAFPSDSDHEKNLVHRSFGHALAPLAIFILAGVGVSSQDYAHLKTFFAHYILARQINDDAHDWREDMTQGHMSPLVIRLLRGVRRKNQKKGRLSLIMARARTLFWRTVSLEVGQSILNHVVKARIALEQISVFGDKQAIDDLLRPLEKAARDLLRQQKETTQFVAAFTAKKA